MNRQNAFRPDGVWFVPNKSALTISGRSVVARNGAVLPELPSPRIVTPGSSSLRSLASTVVLLFCVVIVLALLSGCNRSNGLADAYGNFESDEVIVSAEVGGRLMSFAIAEGDALNAGDVVGLIDTLQLSLQRNQFLAQRRAVRSRMPGIAAQMDVLKEQKAVAIDEQQRVERLLADGAATQKQKDDIDGQLRVLDRQIASVRSQNAPLVAEMEVVDTQLALLNDKIARSLINNPQGGTVLMTYVAAHELATPGKPLYKIANLETLDLKAYITGSQLAEIRLGQELSVRIDGEGGGTRELPGVVTWIASQAEFTPKLIQTREERVNLVYAFKVRVDNRDGLLKIGMPGEVWLNTAE